MIKLAVVTLKLHFNQIQKNPFVLSGLGIITGIIINSFIFISTLIFILFIFKFNHKVLVLFLISFFIGQIYSENFNNKINSQVESLNTKYIEAEAKIIEPPSENEFYDQAVIKIDGIEPYIITELQKFPNVSYGDTIYIEGELSKIESLTDSYANYLNSKKIFLKLNIKEYLVISRNDNLLSLFNSSKEELIKNTKKYLNEPENGLLNGIVLGYKSSISEELKENLQNTGTSHIISASGFNIVILYLVLNFLSGVINRKFVYISSIVVILAYLLLIGIYNLPALRASIMLISAIIYKLFGRKVNVVVILNISILVILLINPLSWRNISFQLSVLATIGLFLFTNTFKGYLKKYIKIDSLNEIVSSTLSVLITTLPITILAFDSTSLISVISNILILPIIPIITILGLYSTLFSIVGPYYLNLLLFSILELLLSLVLFTINKLGSISFASSSENYKEVTFLLLIITLFFIALINKYSNKHESF